MFSGHKAIKVENNNRKVSGKAPNILKLNNILLNNSCIKEEIKREIRNHFELKQK